MSTEIMHKALLFSMNPMPPHVRGKVVDVNYARDHLPAGVYRSQVERTIFDVRNTWYQALVGLRSTARMLLLPSAKSLP